MTGNYRNQRLSCKAFSGISSTAVSKNRKGGEKGKQDQESGKLLTGKISKQVPVLST